MNAGERERLRRRVGQIATTVVPVACVDLGIYQAFHPTALSGSVVIAKADLEWLIRAALAAEGTAESGRETSATAPRSAERAAEVPEDHRDDEGRSGAQDGSGS